MFFYNHPKVLTIDRKVITDLTASISFFDGIKGTNACLEYYIKEGDTPESLSNVMYGTQEYSWVILLLNNMKDITRDWPKSSQNFNSYLIDKYDQTCALFLKLDSIKNYDINKGDKICLLGTDNNYAEVVEWIPSLSKLVIKYIDDVAKNPYEKNKTIAFVGSKNEQLAIIGRVVLNSLYSLHHFEFSKNYLDPLTGLLQSYINSDSSDFVVTDQEYETSKNDSKRFIYLVKIDMIDKVVKDYNKLMNQNNI